jgi:hypothetical protein
LARGGGGGMALAAGATATAGLLAPAAEGAPLSALAGAVGAAAVEAAAVPAAGGAGGSWDETSPSTPTSSSSSMPRASLEWPAPGVTMPVYAAEKRAHLSPRIPSWHPCRTPPPQWQSRLGDP